MIRYSLQLLILVFLWSCNSGTDTSEGNNSITEETTQQTVVSEDGTYGAKISGENAIDGKELVTMLNEQDSVWVTLKSNIVTNCQHSGCWMDLNMGNEEVIKVTFKDYEFFIPLDSQGKTAIVEGFAKRELIPVDMLKHYAEDDGKSQEEIDAITEAKMSYIFEAIGVVISE